jgi:MinD superfamily P-loop ATPase
VFPKIPVTIFSTPIALLDLETAYELVENALIASRYSLNKSQGKVSKIGKFCIDL